MCSGALLASAAFSGLSSGLQGSAQKKEARAARETALYRSQLAQRKAEVANILAADEIVLGQREANILRQRGNQLRGSQKAAAGASGVQMNFGSPNDVITSTDKILQIDEAVIKDNADRKAFTHKVNAMDLLAESSFQQSTASRMKGPSFGTTLLSGLSNSASLFLAR